MNIEPVNICSLSLPDKKKTFKWIINRIMTKVYSLKTELIKFPSAFHYLLVLKVIWVIMKVLKKHMQR